MKSYKEMSSKISKIKNKIKNKSNNTVCVKYLRELEKIEEKELRMSINYETFSEFFDVHKFKIRNDYNRKKCKEFLKEKDICLQEIDLDDEIPDEVRIVGAKRSSTKFTFGFP